MARDAAGFPVAAGDAVLLDEEETGFTAGIVTSAGPGRAVVAVRDRSAWTRPLGIEVDLGRSAYLAAGSAPRGALAGGVAGRCGHVLAALGLAGELAYVGDGEGAARALREARPAVEELAGDLVALACAAEVAAMGGAGSA